jgi:preprotein translocase subunit SecG
MYAFLIIIHVLVCLVLILVVLLQAGRGGGMSEMLGGGQPQSLFGTQTNVFMTRATEVCAVLFVVTSLSLGILSTQRGKSLIEGQRRAARALEKGTVPPASAASSKALPVSIPTPDQTPEHEVVIPPEAAESINQGSSSSSGK